MDLPIYDEVSETKNVNDANSAIKRGWVLVAVKQWSDGELSCALYVLGKPHEPSLNDLG